MARIRTLNFLPEIFQTPTNSQFLSATLDRLVSNPSSTRVQGYIGSRFGPGINALDYYVTEPTKTRVDYQLEPGVVFTKLEEEIANDFITYPGMVDALEQQGAITNNNNRLFNSQIYSWDSFTNLDKLVNYYEYFWLPTGAPAVTVAPSTVFINQDYTVTSFTNTYEITEVGSAIGTGTNPTISVLRGGTYTFEVNQDSQFWIQTEPGTSGYSLTQPNIPTREVFGVDNNGASVGFVTFNVPLKNAQDQYVFPGNNFVDVICDIPFDQVNGRNVYTINDPATGMTYPGLENIDGITGLDGLRIMFYETGVPQEQGYISSYYDETFYDQNDPFFTQPKTVVVSSTNSVGNVLTLASGYTTDELLVNQTVTFGGVLAGGIIEGQVYFIKEILSSTDFTISLDIEGDVVSVFTQTGAEMTVNINQGQFEQGFYTTVSETFYRIQYLGDPNNPTIRLLPDGIIPNNEKITPRFGTQYINRSFYRNTLGVISIIPIITAPLDVLYYQDGTNPNKVGVIKINDSDVDNFINIETEILGRPTYTSPNGVQFTNGLKVQFDGNVFPSNYLTGEYYVEGVGTAIELIPVSDLVCPEKFSRGDYVPYDTAGYDDADYDIELFVPVDPDYITIARNSISKNAWSRSNRWFHIDVINATAKYNDNPNILTDYATLANKAKRPIIEFYPNLKMFDSGVSGKRAVDFFDTRATDALSNVAGLNNYYPDVETYTSNTAVVVSTPTDQPAVEVVNMLQGKTYILENVNDTGQGVWNTLAGTEGVFYFPGDKIVCKVNGDALINPGTGTGKLVPDETTIVIPSSDITGTFQIGMFVGDTLDIIPTNAQIIDIVDDGTTTTLTINWPFPQNLVGGTTSIVGTDTTVSNYAVFPGSRIVFSHDTDMGTRHKIYVVDIVVLAPGTKPQIVLIEAEDAEVLTDQQVVITRGYSEQGKTFYYDGLQWKQAQQKVTVNQAPYFDVFDENGISFGDSTVYNSTSFTGATLFSYGINPLTVDDPILGLPVRFTDVGNIGDISFDVTINSDTFNYVRGIESRTQKVNTGYVHNYINNVEFTRELGWKPAVESSAQYQVFNFRYNISNPTTQFVCDIAALPEVSVNSKGWPRVKVYNNNTYLEPSEYTVDVLANTTVIRLNNPPNVDTVIQVLLLSDQVSRNGYYEIPDNLNSNPFNEDLTVADLGDIRNHYQDIFVNAPNTTGSIFGSNNYRDCGDLTPYGTKIIQNSASMVLPGVFLRKTKYDLLNALMFNSNEYVKFKQLLVDTIQNTQFSIRNTPAEILDEAIEQIAASKSEISSFYWSDMLPNRSPLAVNTYNFNSNNEITRYPLSKVYDFASANYDSVLVYLNRTVNGNLIQRQLLRNIDYEISTDSPTVIVTLSLVPGDKIVVKEYNQTYGSFVPNTPSKLGIYPLYEPSVVLDNNYSTPTYFIKGHDGSYTKLYGQYIIESDTLVDFRDQALLEFEKRVYNNTKLDTEALIKLYDVLPGFFRDSNYSYDEWLQMYSTGFLNWVGKNRIDYKTQFYNRNNEFTYNYSNNASDKLNNQPIQQGYWRGIYQYLYDTTTPNLTPWEMLGFVNKPSWWEERYGPAPYTSDNLVLWNDLEKGIVYSADGTSVVVDQVARPGLTSIIPVDSNGNLVSPLQSVVGIYNPNTFQKDWKVGDDGPAELSYRRSSSYPFDVVRIFSLTKPAEFYNLAIDLDNYKYSAEFDQYLVNNRSHLVIENVDIYGNGTAKTSYINWIVDYEKQFGVDATQEIKQTLSNLDVRLVYRLAGYSDKSLLNFYAEKGSPNTANAALLIPDESYSVLLYDNQPFDKVIFSSVIIQKTTQGGYTVFGNSQSFAYFRVKSPIINGKVETVTVLDQTVKLAIDYSSDEVLVPYGTTFYSTQEVAQFIMSYNAYLLDKGMKFNEIIAGVEVNWNLMVQQFLYWTQLGWDDGSLVTLNPAATDLVFDREGSIVQPLTLQQQNFILNQDLYPMQINTICVTRDGTKFKVHTLNEGDSISYAQFNVSNFEHGVVFNNTTMFNDVIYNLVTGLRQNRITLRGTKTSEWNGTVDAWGFIINQDNVKEWSKDTKYPKGTIVLHKNKYYTALRLVEPATIFNELDWKQINYEDVQKGLLPNSATRSYESSLYYNCNTANLEQDADLLAMSLIGYRPRDYLALADLTDVTQVNVYKNLIKNKGTVNAVTAFNGVTLPQGEIEYDVYENWAIKTGDYGGVLSQNFVEFNLDQSKLTGNPTIVSLTNGVFTEGSQQEVPLYGLYNYGDAITDPNILATTTDPRNNLYPSAGYANFNDVKMSSFYYGGLPNAVDKNGLVVPIQNFYVRDYLWLANFKEKWGIYSWKPIGEIVEVTANLNNTTTVTFSQPHNLNNLDPLAIINFSQNVDGYYIVTQVVNLNQVIINLDITNIGSTSLQGSGVGLLIYSQRVSQPGDINTLPLLEAEFSKNTVWVDENTDGGWAVYRKSINYARQGELSVNTSETFGNSVAFTENAGYFIADSALGKVYRYYYDSNTGYRLTETISQSAGFGEKIAHNNDTFVISQPTTEPNVYVYVWNNTVLANEVLLSQTIPAPISVVDWGSEVAISGDGNWIYISAYTPDTDSGPEVDNSKREVYIYRKQNINFSAGYFEVGQSYVITDLGDTDFTTIGAIENKVGIAFVAADGVSPAGTLIGSGTGTANKSTYVLVNIVDGSALGLLSADGFGKSIATDYHGDCVFIGAPNKEYNENISDWGEAYFYQRAVQKFESTAITSLEQPQFFAMGWTPNTAAKNVTATSSVTNAITLADTSGVSVNDAVTFVGMGLAGTDITAYQTYYVAGIDGNDITIKLSRSTDQVVTVSEISSITNAVAYVQAELLSVTVNGRMVQDNNYAVMNSTLIYSGTLNAGDIIVVDGNEFYNVQTFNAGSSDRINIQFGYDLDVTQQASELLIGSPYEIDSENREGLVYRFTNSGARFGVVVGQSECDLTSTRNILINGYLVTLTAGNAESIADQIATARVPNVTAAATPDNKLVVQVVDVDLAEINQKLMITAFDNTTLGELGIIVYSPTQVIVCPHEEGPTQFGKAIKFNQFDSVVIGAPAAPSFVGTTFDFTDDENLNNDTVFDNNSTRFVENYPNAGAVYIFDLLTNNNGSLLNPGAFVYAQSVNSETLDFVVNPYYGNAVDFYDNSVVVGAPNLEFNPGKIGQVTTFVNSTGVKNWSVFRQTAPIVDINKIQNTQLFSASTNNTLVNLDYMDPLQNKLLGAIRENIDYVSPEDPAKYNVDPLTISDMVWGSQQVGKIWFNTSTVRFVNYHQNDPVYNSVYWGAVFPGSDVSVCTWVASNTIPSQYQGPGIPLDTTKYSVGSTLNASNIVTPVYYFWVRNTGVIVKKRDKTLSDAIIASYIANPSASGIAYMAPLLPNTFALYNTEQYVDDTDTVLHIGYATNDDTDISHNEFKLIRQNFPDDFLPGLPGASSALHMLPQHGQYPRSSSEPSSLYARMIDSLAGTSISGEIVPNPFLPHAVQSGVLTRPRQSFFYNRFEALKNYLTYANTVLAEYPIIEIKPDISFAFVSDEFFNTKDYWEYINWWAPGYNDSTRAFVQVPLYADLAELNVNVGTLVKVQNNGTGSFEIYRYDGNNVWTRVGLQNGTIQFSSALWEYSKYGLGYGNDFYDTTAYDDYPSEATRNIIRLLNEQIYTQDLLIHRNKSLILLLDYIQTETTESQNYLPWLSKTSLMDVFHTVRELKPYQVFKSDNVEFLEGYLNEVKPYHVVVKEFLVKYDGLEVYEGDFTDFDVPATYNTTVDQYISPQLVFSEPNNEYEYDDSSAIWSSAPYTKWYQNYGLSLVGQENYQITTLKSYLDLGSNQMIVDNASGFPSNGVIRIDQELISYAFVDRNLNLIGGLSRGLDGTVVSEHIPDSFIYIDLPPVVVLDEGSSYTQVPKITAYVDTNLYPAPRKEAILQAVMSGGRVSAVKVIDPGEGYVVLPEIKIDPAYTITFSDADINASLHTININAPLLKTGELVRFRSGTNGAKPNNLVNDAWYYVGVLETLPSIIVALYNSYGDAVKDQNRIKITPGLASNDMSLAPGARASTITSSSPTRENNITMRFDRTTYESQVIDWESGIFYGAFFAGTYYNSDKISSSAITLENAEPSIDNILASAQGVALQITDVDNESELVWSSFVRYIASTTGEAATIPNAIQLIPQDGNNPDLSELENNASGTTIGFYIGMPIKFVGATVGGLLENTTYYVSAIHDDINFSVSEIRYGETKTLSAGTVPAQLLKCYSGTINDTVILTVEYPGILQVTQTQGTVNALTVPLSPVGTGGTTGFYTDLPIFFTGNVFGGIIENLNYYITTVIDNETFTISEEPNPISTILRETKTADKLLVVDSTNGFSRNDPIIFTSLTDGLVNSGIISGKTYYVSQIISVSSLTISEIINGDELAVVDGIGTADLVNQKNTVKLENATGSMTMNVSLPVSPGQVNGQLFTLYQTSGQFTDIVPTGSNYSNLINRTIRATIGTNYGDPANKIAISEIDGGTFNFYTNMPIQVLQNVGGLAIDTTYYVTEYSGQHIPDPEDPLEFPTKFIVRPNIQVEVTNSSDIGNLLTCTVDSLRGYDGTDSLYSKMPIRFRGSGLGGVVIDQEYFVKDIVNATQFTISEIPDGPVKDLSLANGLMIGTGDPYIKVSLTKDGTPEILSNTNDATSSFTQFVIQDPVFDLSYMVGGYRAIVSDPGEGFAINNTILIPGTAVSGTSPKNDILLTVNEVDGNGGIKSVIRSGTPPTVASPYYLQVRSANTLAVYKNNLLTIPASSAEFNYVGYTIATVTNSTTDTLTVDVAGFERNDAVVFTGNVPTGIERGKTYYLYNVTDTTTQITLLPNDGAPVTGIGFNGEFTMAKLGSIALLPEPFTFNQSIVRFNNRVYVCVISNNDDEFIIGKWELLDSDDRRLNAMDRVIGYYQPTVNMPGVDLPQLFEGTTYPNPTYLGNNFDPKLQYSIDAVLTPLPFYPSEVDVTGIIWDGNKYLASANLLGYNAILTSGDTETWTINQLTNNNINTTNIALLNGLYLLTTTSPTVPILRSVDGLAWSAVSYFVPFGTSDLELQNLASLNIPSLSLNDVAYCPGGMAWVAVGRNILRSDDGIVWRELTDFNPSLEYDLKAISTISGTNCQGLVAVGKGKQPNYSTGVTQLVDVGLIFYSQNSRNWNQIAPLTDNGLYGVASNGTIVIAVGENQVIYYTQNGFDWVGLNEVECVFADSIDNILNVTNTAGFVGGAAGTAVRFNASFSTIVANTTYYVKEVISETQVSLSETLDGSVLILTSSDVPENAKMSVYDSSNPNPAKLNDIVYADNLWVTVGDAGTIKTSTDGLVWETRNSNTDNNLNNVTHNSVSEMFVAVGDNNTILSSADGVVWEETSVFNPIEPVYDVTGANFQFGYAPEELVAGVVSDNLAMIVSTRPGTNWPATEYGHTGYNVASAELVPATATQLEYSFASLANVPAKISVQVIDGTTGLGTTMSPDSYVIDWVNKTVILNQALQFSPVMEKLRIDVYEVGNGDQLVKASTDTYPIITNSISGFNEINLSCNYSATIFEGSGALRPGTDNINVRVYATEEITNRIFCDDVKDFIINSPITFQGVLFGGIQEETVYYVKTISVATNAITVSSVFDFMTGVAGPTTELSTATGEMFANIQNGTGAVWSDPIVEHNGEKLVFGGIGLVTRSKASNNALTTGTTSGLVVGSPITFCQCVFGNIVPFKRYYIHSIVDSNEFTISESSGGPVMAQIDFVGTSTFITNDYSIGLRNGNKAKLVFATNEFTNDTDYIVFSIFGETQPDQYGYSLPETQYYFGNGSTSLFQLNNFIGLDNAENAIVEVGGVRLPKSQYTINTVNKTILFSSPPPADTVASVTTYNDTLRQYFTSQFDITGNPGSSLTNLVVVETVNTVGKYDQTYLPVGAPAEFGPTQAYDQGPGPDYPPTPTITTAGNFNTGIVYTIYEPGTTDFTLIGAANNNPGTTFTATGPGTGDGTAFAPIEVLYDEALNYLKLGPGYDTSILNINDSLEFSSPTLGGIVPGTTYYVVDIINSTDFVISEQVGGNPFVVYDDTGSMSLLANGLTVAPIVNISNNLAPPIAATSATASTAGAPNEITVDSVAGFIINQPVQFYGTSFDANIMTDGTVYFVDSIDTINDTFTIKDIEGDQIITAGGVGNMTVVVGGQPTVRVTTSIAHKFVENTLVRIAGTSGSVQLNNNAYYAKIIDQFTFDIYNKPYNSGLTAVNDPVTTIETYTGGGYTWRQGLFFITTTTAIATSAFEDTITVETTDKLVPGTPVYFNKVETSNNDVNGDPTMLMGGLTQGTLYYVKDVIDATTFTVSLERNGLAVSLTDDTGRIGVTQWAQDNVDRLHVTINGYRVPSSSLVLNDFNEVSILTKIVPGDRVIITSMIPSSTPDEETYINFVNNTGDASVYRVNPEIATWVTETAYPLATEIFVNDVTKLTRQVVQDVIVPSTTNGFYYLGLSADKNLIANVTIFNKTTGNFLPQEAISVVLIDLAPNAKIVPGPYITVNDELTITTLEGNLVYINGEQIKFGKVDFVNNSLQDISRGVNGTGAQNIIPAYSTVLGLLSINQLPDIYYNQTWNSNVFNQVEGDPLQISDTIPAQFLSKH